MSDMSDVIQIDINSDISDGVKAKRSLEEIAEQTEKLQAALQAGAIDMATFNYQMSRIDKQSKAAATSVASASVAFDDVADGTTKISKGTGLASNNLMVLGQTLDDLQYVPEQGLRPIIGNIMQISPAAGIALIGVTLLGKAITTLAGQFAEAHVQTEAERLEELGKKAHKTADEYAYLAKVQRGEQAVQTIANARPEAESKADEAAGKAIGNAGGYEAVAAAMRAGDPGLVNRQPAVMEAQKNLDDMTKKAADFQAKFGKGMAYDVMGFDNVIAAFGKQLELVKKNTAVDLMKEAITGQDTPGGRARLAESLGKNPAAMGGKAGELATTLKGLDKTPADVESDKLVAEDKAARIDGYNAQAKAQADLDLKYAQDEEKADQDAQKLFDAQEKHYQDQLARWQADGDRKIADENLAAETADAMTAHKKELDRQNQSAQIFNGPAALRDAIQQSVKADKDPTAVEQLATQREIAANTRRMAEAREARQVARFN